MKSCHSLFPHCKIKAKDLYHTALQSKFRLRNTLVHLVEHNRPHLEQLESILGKMNEKFKKEVKRCNDVFFGYAESGHYLADATIPLGEIIKNTPPFTIKAFPYSRIGEGINVTIDPSSDSASILSSLTASCNDGNSDEEEIGDHSFDLLEPNTGSESGTSSTNESSRSSDSEVDEESSEQLPTTGVITGVKIVSNHTMSLRARKWKKKGQSKVAEEKQEKKDFLNYCLRTAHAMEIGGQLPITDASSFQVQGPFSTLPTDYPIALKPGWAKQPAIGAMYGKKNIELYKSDIKEMFMAGVENEGNKKRPGRMLEELQKKYVSRFDLSTETEIRNEIGNLMKSLANGPSRPKSIVFSAIHVQLFEKLLCEVRNVMPKEAVKIFQQT